MAEGEEAVGEETERKVLELERQELIQQAQAMGEQAQVLARTEQLRAEGNTLFRSGEFERAETTYRDALEVTFEFERAQAEADEAASAPDRLKPEAPNVSPEMVSELHEAQAACWLNIAMCGLKQNDYEVALVASNAALKCKPDHPKGLYRRGQANHGLKRFAAAREDLKEALKHAPNDAAIVKLLKAVRGEEKEAKAADQKMVASMFEQGGLYKGANGWRYPRCFFELSLDPRDCTDDEGNEIVLGRVVFELFIDRVPKTCENFRALCTGEKGLGKVHGKPLHYKGTKILRIQEGFSLEGGDIVNNDGTEGESIYGGYFEDENFKVPHDDSGILTMVNKGPGTNNSQWAVLMQPAPWCDRKYVAFGRVVEGMGIFRDVEKWPRMDGQLISNVIVRDCGELEPL